MRGKGSKKDTEEEGEDGRQAGEKHGDQRL